MELLIGIAVIIIVVVAIKLGKQDNSTAAPVKTAQTDEELIQNANYLMSLMEVRRQASDRGDTATVAAVDNMTYDGPLPEKLADGSYTRIYTLYDYNIAGINYRDGIADYLGDFEGYLQPDPDNEHDPNAIAIYHSDGHHLGYIPQNMTDDIRDCGLPFPIQIWGDIEEDYDYDEKRRFFRGTVWMEIPDPNATHPYVARVNI